MMRFAQTVGEYEDYAALLKDVSETLERQATQNIIMNLTIKLLPWSSHIDCKVFLPQMLKMRPMR